MAQKQQLSKKAASVSGAAFRGKNGQPADGSNIFDFETGKPVRAHKHDARNLKKITIEYFDHAVVDGKNGNREVVDVFDERHPYHSKNLRKGGKTAEVQDFFSKHRDDHSINEDVYS